MIQLKDVLADESRYEISLSKLLGGLKIKDIRGFITKNWEDALFEITYIELDDGTKIHIGGEHDCPYLEIYHPEKMPNLSDEVLESLYKESNGEDEPQNEII